MPDFPIVTQPIASTSDIAMIDVAEASTLVVSIAGGTVNATGVALAFEVSVDGGTWHQSTAARSNANTAESVAAAFSLAAGVALAHAWELSVVGWQYARVRPTAITAGDIVVRLSAARDAIDPAPVVAPHAVTSTPAAGSAHTGTTTAAAPAGAIVTNSATALYEITVSNVTTSAICVKLYDKATTPSVGTDVPRVTFFVEAGFTRVEDFGALGKRFNSGLGIAITAQLAATDTTPVQAGAVWSLTRG